MNTSRVINLSEMGIDLVTTAEQRRLAASSGGGAADILVTGLATTAFTAVGGGLVKGILGKGPDLDPLPPLLQPGDTKPEDVDLGVGFALEKFKPEQGLERFMRWIKKQWFLPSDMEDKFSTAEMERVYIPFWVFATRSKTSFQTRVLVPTEEFLRSGSPLLTRDLKALEDETVPKEWVQVMGSREDVYDRIILVATDQPRLVKFSKDFGPKHWQYQHAKQPISKLPPDRQAALPQPIDWQELWTDYTRKNLAEFEKKKCKRLMEREAAGRKFVRTKEIDTQTTYFGFRRRLVYLPIYTLDYYYDETPYSATIHGLTGKVIGDRPYGLGALGKSNK